MKKCDWLAILTGILMFGTCIVSLLAMVFYTFLDIYCYIEYGGMSPSTIPSSSWVWWFIQNNQ